MVRKWQKRFASAMPRRRAEPHAWEMVAKMVGGSSAQLQSLDRYDKLGVMALRMGWTAERQRALIEKEKTRDVIVGVLREKAEERAREAAERRRREEEERIRRIEERKAQMEADRQRREEERKLRETQDGARMAKFRAEQGEEEPLSEEALAAQREEDAALRDSKNAARESYRKALEERKRSQREKMQETKQAQDDYVAPEAPKLARADDLEFMADEEYDEPQAVPAPKAVKTTTILEKMSKMQGDDIFFRSKPAAKPVEEVVYPRTSMASVVESSRDMSAADQEIILETVPDILDDDGPKVTHHTTVPTTPPSKHHPRTTSLPDMPPPTTKPRRRGGNEYNELPSGTPEGPKRTYSAWMNNWNERVDIKWVINSKGFRGGGDCLADLIERRHPFTDTHRAALIETIVKRSIYTAADEGEAGVRPRHRGPQVLPKMKLSIFKPIDASMKKVPPGSASLHQYFRLLNVLELPDMALTTWKAYKDVEKTGVVYLAAINALLPSKDTKRTLSNRPSAGGRLEKSPLDLLEQAERIFDEFMVEFQAVSDELDMLTDAGGLRKARTRSRSELFHSAASALILAWSQQRFYQKADGIWEKVKANANTKVRRMYMRRFTSEQRDDDLGKKNIEQARILLETIPVEERQEVDYRTVLEAYKLRADAQGAEDFIKTIPAPVNIFDRMRTMAVLLGVYAQSSKRAVDDTPQLRVEKFMAAVKSITARCEEMTPESDARSTDHKLGLEEIAVATVQGLQMMYAPRPRPHLATAEDMKVWEEAAPANRSVLAVSDTLLESAGFDAFRPDGEEPDSDLPQRPSSKLVTQLMYLYLTALDERRATSLYSQVKAPLRPPRSGRTFVDQYKNIIKMIAQRRTVMESAAYAITL